MTVSSTARTTAGPPAEPPEGATIEPTALAVFRRLDERGISCTFWKGTIRLRSNLRGGGDLDLLVHADDVGRLRRELTLAGWQRAGRGPGHEGQAIEDHFLVDETTGRIVHLDACTRLRPEGFVRELPEAWHGLLLGRRRITEDHLPVPEPAVEAALLLLRLTRESHRMDGLVRARRRRPLPQRQAELAWLLAQTTEQEVLEVLEATIPGGALTAASAALLAPDRQRLARLRRRLGPAYGPVRPALSDLAAARDTTRRVRRAVNKRWLHRPVLLGRGIPGGGRVVAVVGSDGSGKSTLVRGLTAEYSAKFDTLDLYLGSGDGPASLLRLPMKLAHRVLRPGKDAPSAGRSKGRRPMRFVRAVWAVTLAREKRQRLQRAHLARSRGLLVICDRYPQVQFPGENDGPLLSGWETARSPLLRWLASIERRPYVLAGTLAPDLVIKLDVDAITARRRRPGSTESYLAHRGSLVRGLTWDPDRTRVVTLDATASPAEVFRSASRAIWEARSS
jgi:hypothetical protein